MPRCGAIIYKPGTDVRELWLDVHARNIVTRIRDGIVPAAAQQADEIGVTAAGPEGEDVGLPHLVVGGPLEKTRTDQVAPRLGWGVPSSSVP